MPDTITTYWKRSGELVKVTCRKRQMPTIRSIHIVNNYQEITGKEYEGRVLDDYVKLELIRHIKKVYD